MWYIVIGIVFVVFLVIIFGSVGWNCRRLKHKVLARADIRHWCKDRIGDPDFICWVHYLENGRTKTCSVVDYFRSIRKNKLHEPRVCIFSFGNAVSMTQGFVDESYFALGYRLSVDQDQRWRISDPVENEQGDCCVDIYDPDGESCRLNFEDKEEMVEVVLKIAGNCNCMIDLQGFDHPWFRKYKAIIN